MQELCEYHTTNSASVAVVLKEGRPRYLRDAIMDCDMSQHDKSSSFDGAVLTLPLLHGIPSLDGIARPSAAITCP